MTKIDSIAYGIYNLDKMQRKVYVWALFLLVAGVFVYLLFFSEHYAFLADKPKSCAACHQMDNAYHSWELAAQTKGVTCNDCHVDNGDLMSVYTSKLKDGFHHGKAWLFASIDGHHVVLQDSTRVQNNCMRCHSSQLSEEHFGKIHKKHFSADSKYVCWRCHDNAGHQETKSEARHLSDGTLPKPVWLIKLESQ